MKKLVRTSLNNVANKRGVRDLNIQLYSHDKNNAGFEFVIKNEVDLSEYKAKVLFDFQESFATWETKGTIEGNVVKVKFDTTFITKCEEVIGYLFLDSETDTLDVFKFKFNVVLSEIDKYDLGKRGFRYIKDQEVVDVITRSELEEELKKLQINGGIDLSNYLTTSAANETFATKQELSTYATKDELPSISGLVTTEQLITAKNSVIEEISNKGYVTTTVAEETYAKKSEIPQAYNDSALSERVTNLENKTDKDTVYDDTSVKERLTALENKPAVDTSNSEIRGTGMPNGVVEAPIGATYIDTAKTNGALKWIKTTDGGNTGWKVVEGDTGWVLCKRFEIGSITNSIYIRRMNDTVHVKTEASYAFYIYLKGDVNLHLANNYEVNEQLSIDGFKPTTTIAHRITRSLDGVHLGVSERGDESHTQSIGTFILGYDNQQHLTLKIFRASISSVEQCYVRPFSYLTEDEWPTTLPTI